MASGNEPKPFESVINAETTDLNNCTTTGFYSWGENSANNPMPGVTANGNLLVINGVQFLHQICFYSNGDIYMRRRNLGGSWNDWRHILLS